MGFICARLSLFVSVTKDQWKTLLPTPMSRLAGVGRTFGVVCQSCLFVCLGLFVCPQHNLKTNDPKVFKFGAGNDLGIY